MALCPAALDLASQANYWLPLPDAAPARRYGILLALDRLAAAL